MKILAYAHPAVMTEGASFNMGWPLLLLSALAPMCRKVSTIEASIILGSRFMGAALDTEPPPNLRLVPIEETRLHRALSVYDKTLGQLSSAIFHRRWDEPVVGALTTFLLEALKDAGICDRPDLILSFSVDAGFFKQIWPDVPVFNVEVGPFSRHYFPRSLFFDHVGIYRNSALTVLTQGRDGWGANAWERQIVTELQTRVGEMLREHDPFLQFDYRRRHDRLCLLPLQVNGSFPFNAQCDYRSQFEFLVDFLAKAPDDVGVVVTEYNGWGSCLDTPMPGRSLEFLKQFPSFLYPAKSRNYASPSYFLTPKVDGVWSISSNVGWFARFCDKLLGSPSDSHLGGAASAHDIPAFMASLGKKSEPSTDMLAWMLNRYYVPESLYLDGGWMYEYLSRRLAACETSDLAAAFVPFGDEKQIRAAWSHPFPGEADLHCSTVESQALLSLHSIGLKTPLAHQAVRSGGSDGKIGLSLTRPAYYVLLNDTKKVEGERHLGSSAVTDFIRASLALRGYAAAKKEPLPHSGTELMLLNGEGTLHSSRQSIRALLRACDEAKASGGRTTLINATYQNNDEDIGRSLKVFDLVTVRESCSLHAILPWRPDARIVPDLSFEAFHAESQRVWNGRLGPRRPDDSSGVVVDSVFPEVGAILHDYARFRYMPFLVMGKQAEDHFHTQESVYQLDRRLYPDIVRAPADFSSFHYGVTGRFHGLILLLMTRTIPLALPSNTHKIEGLLDDIGIREKVMLPAEWLEKGHNEKQEIVLDRVARWTAADWEKVAEYCSDARRKIASLFDDLTMLAGATPARRDEQPTVAEKTWSLATGEVDAAILGYGWSVNEPGGTWTVGPEASLFLPLDAMDANSELEVELSVNAHVNERRPQQKVDVIANGEHLETGVFYVDEGARCWRFVIPQRIRQRQDVLALHFEIHFPHAPRDVGGSFDARLLGIFCSRVKLLAN